MRIWNKPRGSGKTTRMLYASEFTGKSILVSSRERAHQLESYAKQLDLKVPKILAVVDFLDRDTNYCSEDIIIDEAFDVLETIVKEVGHGTKISDITLTCYEGVRNKC